MKKYMTLAAGALLTLSSCSTITHTQQAVPVNTEVYSLTVADLNVKPKAETTVEFKWNPLSTVSLAAQKKTAAATLLNEADADILVEPKYEVTRRGLFRGGSVTVSGYPAKYSNFRTMTQSDAEKIAALNGALTCQSSVAAVSPIINTSAHKPAKPRKPKPAEVINEMPSRTNFISIFGGVMEEFGHSRFEHEAHYGVMYGNYGKRWGWYGKLALTTADCSQRYSDGYYGYSEYETKSKTTPSVTFGAIKTLGKHWNVMLGAGVGGYFCTEYDYRQDTSDDVAKFSIPVDLFFQYHVKGFNALVGLNYATPCETSSDKDISATGNVNIFVGIGLNF